MNNKISIIVPIYNCENYLKNCIESIIQQTYTNLEILLINDGSTDNSEEICINYKKNDHRIKYLYKTNSGVSETRNIGINISKGKYIMFIDSDDYIDKHYIEHMYNKLTENSVNICTSGMTIINEKNKIIKKTYFKTSKAKLELKDYIDTFINYPYFSCTKMLIKKDIIKGIRFETNLKYGEDMLFAFNLLKNNLIYYTNNCGYCYRQNNQSVTNKADINSMKTYMNNTIYLFNEILKENPKKQTIIANRLLSKLNISCIKLCKNKKIKFHELKTYIEYYKKIINIKYIDLNKITYERKISQIRMFLIYHNMYFAYYNLNKIINNIKKNR